MFAKWLFLLNIGICAGGIVAAGVFAFLAMIGVYPRIIGKTGTNRSVMLYETFIMTGGIFGNLWYLYQFPTGMDKIPVLGNVILGIFGGCVGIFIGCLVMSLAETLKAIPVMNRRIRLGVGFQYIILAIAAGKWIGSWIYFIHHFGT